MIRSTISTEKVESYLSKFLKTPAQNSKALEDLWLDPVHKNFFPQMSTEVKQ